MTLQEFQETIIAGRYQIHGPNREDLGVITLWNSGFLHFIHRFGPKLHCIIRIRDQPPADGDCLDLSFEWIGRPKPKHINEYRQWILGVIQILADRWGASVLYCLGTKRNQTELWRIAAGEAPRLLETLKLGIP